MTPNLGNGILDHRFKIVFDLNGDGAFTISDVWEWVKWIYFAPGDYLIIQLLNAEVEHTAVGRFFELSSVSIGGIASGAFSAVVLLIAFVIWELQFALEV